MSDLLMGEKLPLAHLCQAKSLYWLDHVKSLKHPTNKSEPKLMCFVAAMIPHLLLLDHSMGSICDQ
jgi:hypothetical protein